MWLPGQATQNSYGICPLRACARRVTSRRDWPSGPAKLMLRNLMNALDKGGTLP
jgi:hypothetical protein